MTATREASLDDEEVSGLRARLREVKADLEKLTPTQLKDGTWFHQNLKRTAERFIEKQRKRSPLDGWRERFPGLDDAQLSGKIIQRTAHQAALLGGTAGVAVTGAGLGALAAGGVSISGAFIVALAELALLERLQVNMVFTLAELHRYPLNHEHLHHVGDLYAHVLKVKGASRAAQYGRQGALALFRSLGVKFVQRAAMKYAIPILSVGVGGGMNYLMTRSLGRHSEKRFQRELLATERLERLDDQDEAYHTLLLSLMMLMASVDGKVDKRERAMLRRTLDQMVAAGHCKKALLHSLKAPEQTLMEALAAVHDPAFADVLMELLALMAVADGALEPAELALMERIAGLCGVPFDEAEICARHAAFLKARAGKGR